MQVSFWVDIKSHPLGTNGRTTGSILRATQSHPPDNWYQTDSVTGETR